MYATVYRTFRLLWPGGMDTRRYLQELERNQWLAPEQFQTLKLQKIQRLVKHAYENVPFYQQRYKQAGIAPQDIKTLKDFEALPFITRQDVNNNREAMVAQNFDRRKLVANETGGSTGQPMHFYIDNSFWWNNAANNFRVHAWYGMQEGDKMAWFWGAQQDMPEWSWRRRIRSALMRERYLNAFNMTESKMKAFAEMLQQWQPYMYKGYATVLTLFAEFVKRQNIKGLHPHFIESTSEKLSTPQRDLLHEVFGCPIVDHYSSREMGTMAYQAPSGKMLVCADMRYIEAVANDKVVAPGNMGEIAVTSLDQFSFPFIRYKNGDMAIMEAGQSSCGRALPIVKEVIGRTNDFLVSADGKFVHSEFFAYTFRVKPEVASYQVHQPDRQHLDIKLTMRQPVSHAWLEAAKAEVQTRFGAGTQVTLEIVDHIELTRMGKHRYIISEVKPEFEK